jgi:hypothetical protein
MLRPTLRCVGACRGAREFSLDFKHQRWGDTTLDGATIFAPAAAVRNAHAALAQPIDRSKQPARQWETRPAGSTLHHDQKPLMLLLLWG